MTAGRMLEATGYVQLVPRWRQARYGEAGFKENEQVVDRFVIENVTQGRPRRATGPVMKLNVKLPASAFEPLRPEVVIEVAEDQLDYTPTVTVVRPEPPAEEGS